MHGHGRDQGGEPQHACEHSEQDDLRRVTHDALLIGTLGIGGMDQWNSPARPVVRTKKLVPLKAAGMP